MSVAVHEVGHALMYKQIKGVWPKTYFEGLSFKVCGEKEWRVLTSEYKKGVLLAGVLVGFLFLLLISQILISSFNSLYTFLFIVMLFFVYFYGCMQDIVGLVTLGAFK